MQEKDIEKIIEAVKADRMSVAEAVAEVKFLPFTDTGFAKVDHHREVRTGFPEVVYCQGKTAGQVREIIVSLRSGTNKNILATRATHEIFEAVKGAAGEARYHENACLIVLEREKQPAVGNVLVIAAGTSDIAVADEAAVTAGALGSRTETLYDVGIAGAHRLFAHKDQLLRARVIVAVAGMEGALPGLVSGLVSAPVIAVPTSVGYGAS
ncbi:MAG: nickel pincer cofactor biosynthesis protein LarB, partial [Terriglobia bacterium]